MNVLIGPDKFKGTLTALAAAEAIAAGVAAFNPNWNVKMIPIADGGEGTAQVLGLAAEGTVVRTQAADALFRPVTCEYMISKDGQTAFIDMASASGLQHLRPNEINAFRCSSQGTGQLVANPPTRKCKRIVLGLGGTATMDCAIGIAQALGIAFNDENGDRISPISGNLGRIEFIVTSHRRFTKGSLELLLLADVNNPLLGPEGARMFAAQKGLEGEDAELMESMMGHFSNLLEAKYGTIAKTPGMGAAGGAALSCMAFLDGKLTNGSEFVLDTLKIDAAIADADLIITGEGQLDAQSLHGKAPVALAKRAQQQGKSIYAICGKVNLDEKTLKIAGFEKAVALKAEANPNGVQAAENLKQKTIELLTSLAPNLK